MSDLGNEGKGFGGLSGISAKKSSEQSTPLPKDEALPRQAKSPESGPATSPVDPQSRSSPPPVSQTKSSSGLKVLVTLAVLAIGGYWVSTLGESSQQLSRSYSPSSSAADAAAAGTAEVTNEDRPPVGTELVLSMRQIRYCVFEKIRLDGAEGAVNQYDSESVDRFNSMVNDFNSRCGSFRYRDGSLAPVEREGLALQDVLRAQGRSLMLGAGSSAIAAADAAAASSDAAAADAAQAAADTAAAAANAAAAAADAAVSPLSGHRPSSGDYYSDAAAAAADAAAAAADVAVNSDNEPVEASEARGFSASVDPENLRTCLSGNYPSLCKRSLLTESEKVQVANAERRENLRTCLSGNYPSLCKRSLLNDSESAQVAEAERRENLRTCMSGNYPSLCKRSLLSSAERGQVDDAERRENLRTCLTGNYPSLCKRSLLSAEEKNQVDLAERRENLRICLSGNYPSLCKRSLLSETEKIQVAQSESRP